MTCAYTRAKQLSDNELRTWRHWSAERVEQVPHEHFEAALESHVMVVERPVDRLPDVEHV